MEGNYVENILEMVKTRKEMIKVMKRTISGNLPKVSRVVVIDIRKKSPWGSCSIYYEGSWHPFCQLDASKVILKMFPELDYKNVMKLTEGSYDVDTVKYFTKIYNYIMEVLPDTYYPMPLREHLDKTNNHLIAFKNGTFNINTRELHDHRPEDMIFTKYKIDYITFNDDDNPKVKEVKNMVSQDFPKKDIKNYMNCLANCLRGIYSDDIRYIFYRDQNCYTDEKKKKYHDLKKSNFEFSGNVISHRSYHERGPHIIEKYITLLQMVYGYDIKYRGNRSNKSDYYYYECNLEHKGVPKKCLAFDCRYKNDKVTMIGNNRIYTNSRLEAQNTVIFEYIPDPEAKEHYTVKDKTRQFLKENIDIFVYVILNCN